MQLPLKSVAQLHTELMINLYASKKVAIHDVIDFLIKHSSSNPNPSSISRALINTQTDSGLSFLHAAILLKDDFFINWLLQYHVNIDIQNKDGDTPLHLATKEKNLPFVTKLIENNANVLIQNNHGETPKMIINRLRTNAYALHTIHHLPKQLGKHMQVYQLIEDALQQAEAQSHQEYDNNTTCIIM